MINKKVFFHAPSVCNFDHSNSFLLESVSVSLCKVKRLADTPQPPATIHPTKKKKKKKDHVPIM